MTDKPEEENEIMAAARIAKERQKGAEGTPEPAKLSKWGIAALGAGVGSAAIAAAVALGAGFFAGVAALAARGIRAAPSNRAARVRRIQVSAKEVRMAVMCRAKTARVNLARVDPYSAAGY